MVSSSDPTKDADKERPMKSETMPSDDQMQALNLRRDRSALNELVRVGAQEMLDAALEAEVGSQRPARSVTT